MSFKRNLSPDVYKSRKKIYSNTGNSSSNNSTSTNISPEKNKDNNDSTRDTKRILEHLHSIFPVEKFEHRLPSIIFKHQLYSISKNKTETDRQLQELRNRDEIRYFHLGIDSDDFDLCIVFTRDYEQHVIKFNKNNQVVDKFLNVVFKECPDVFVSREALMKFQIGDDEISQLFKAGVLTARNLGSWWISIPGAGEFVKCFLQGRKTLLQIVKKSKYGEILQNELETRKLPKGAKLGIMYHIHDIVGAELVNCIYTSSGRLIREKD
uniref:Serine/threonine-protein kinase 19 n=1 Tax=Strigamia maritima TaxID=126957 RepID=T1IN07_STRMM